MALFLEYLQFKFQDLLKSDIMKGALRVKIYIDITFCMIYLQLSVMIHHDLKIANIMMNYILEEKNNDFILF